MASFKNMYALIATLCLTQVTQAVYYLAEPDKWRCFKDTVVNNYVNFNSSYNLCFKDSRNGSVSA
jgi:hypothetical protein